MTETTQTRNDSKRRRVRRLAIGIIVTITAACAPDSGGGTPSDPGPGDTSLPAPRAYHGDESVTLTWGIDEPNATGYEWQWRPSETSTSTSETTEVPEVVATMGLTPNRHYWARVRYLDTDGSAGESSSGTSFFFADMTLPVVRINTEHEVAIGRELYVNASMTIDPNGSGDAAYSGTTQIRGRGNSTWGAPKKPYRLKLSTKSSLMGMTTNRDWILLANFYDPSHLRTELAFDLSRQTDLSFTPTYRYVEVILNGRYDGLYMLGEQVEVDSGRVELDEMGPTDNSGEALTGGYMLEFDFRLDTAVEPGFVSGEGVKVAIKEPDPPAHEQAAYIRSYFNAFEAATLSPTFADPVTGFRSHLDVDAFIDWYIIAELTRQQDAAWASTFLTKPRNGKLTFGPVWDFDLSMGTRTSTRPAGQRPVGGSTCRSSASGSRACSRIRRCAHRPPLASPNSGQHSKPSSRRFQKRPSRFPPHASWTPADGSAPSPRTIRTRSS